MTNENQPVYNTTQQQIRLLAFELYEAWKSDPTSRPGHDDPLYFWLTAEGILATS